MSWFDSIQRSAQHWPRDLSAGFSVSLIALPLSMALAMASEVPPMAGIIASVVGGMVVALFGGSNVTITGAGNGLVVVILSAVTALGDGDPSKGYPYMLAAVVVSGGILLILGSLRMGELGDLFPSSAVQGILGAIGLIFIAKQFHNMIGVPGPEDASNIELLLDIPFALGRFMEEGHGIQVAVIGILSLLIMAFHSRVPFRWFRTLPAPMWVLLFVLSYAFYYEFVSFHPYPIPEEQLIQMPEKMGGSFVFPDFGKLFHSAFIMAVFGITLITGMESLLSLKAVDRLDPCKRRSNADRDLRALGLGSICSGLLGGLPVVTVIARSSVNVNHGARTRASNFFHAACLLLIILLFKDLLQWVPLSALAGILVYTGYKLITPDLFRRIFNVGAEQLLIFLITLSVTFWAGLLQGMAAGILATIMVQFFFIPPGQMILHNPFQPNTLMFQESDGKFYVGVKAYSNFLNYLQLKKQLDVIPRKQHVILDFSLSTFVDHTVMEHIAHYSEDYEENGGRFEVIGLDVHRAESAHPFAPRRVNRMAERPKSSEATLTDRQQALKAYMEELEWEFRPESIHRFQELEQFPLFRTKTIDHVFNRCEAYEKGVRYQLFDVEYYEGAFIAKQVYRTTALLIHLNREVPRFTLDKEGLFHRAAELIGFSFIELEDHPDFSRRFLLKGENEKAIKAFFNRDLVRFFESNPYYHVQSTYDSLLVFKRERLASISEVKALLDYGKRLARTVDDLNDTE